MVTYVMLLIRDVDLVSMMPCFPLEMTKLNVVMKLMSCSFFLLLFYFMVQCSCV